MKDIVKIYALIDPITLKVRYIGRTRCDLNKRLREHVCKSNRYYNDTHKANWIRSLLKMNSRPFIRQLTTIEGWKESHKFERALISKYRDRLLNHDDRGEGEIQHIVTEDQKVRISESLKKFFKENHPPNCKTIYVYKRDGSFYKEYNNRKDIVKDIDIGYSTILKRLHNISKKPRKRDWQFSYNKVESMRDWTKQIKINRRLVW